MKATGIVRRIDDLGRVVIPKELRRTMGIADGDPVEVFVEGDRIILRKYAPGCCLCGIVRDSLTPLYPDKLVCKPCVEMILKNEEKILKAMSTN
ncbi:transcriptional pleiotropic regulator of transition state genes [Paenibacillus sp. DS2015]|uniref:AbrB/MazE/SpoVT family DNA-binding domain-containing protein n=1 Tax=Paenibacillus sp. DS2015 TaxID=3373917 RepID=UPI003D1ABF2A